MDRDCVEIKCLVFCGLQQPRQVTVGQTCALNATLHASFSFTSARATPTPSVQMSPWQLVIAVRVCFTRRSKGIFWVAALDFQAHEQIVLFWKGVAFFVFVFLPILWFYLSMHVFSGFIFPPPYNRGTDSKYEPDARGSHADHAVMCTGRRARALVYAENHRYTHPRTLADKQAVAFRHESQPWAEVERFLVWATPLNTDTWDASFCTNVFVSNAR